MANSCKANAILSFDHFNVSNSTPTLTSEDAYKYGKNLGIAFQLVDDLLGNKINRIVILGENYSTILDMAFHILTGSNNR